MKVFYLRATGLIIEFDAGETKLGIKVLEQVLSIAKSLSETDEDDQFVFDLEAVHGEILEEEYAPNN